MTESAVPPTLTYEDLVVGYGRQRVAGPLSGAFDAGALWLLTGPNGCGKTTFLRTLLGLLRPLGGRVHGLSGRSISYVPQLGTLDGGFPVTAAEVVETGMRSGVQRGDRRTRVEAALIAVDLLAVAGRPFFRLSGGQRQRVLIARALCADADIVALDEPTAGVDAESAKAVWRTLREIADRGGTVLAITHDLFEAPEHADHVRAFGPQGLADATEWSRRVGSSAP